MAARKVHVPKVRDWRGVTWMVDDVGGGLVVVVVVVEDDGARA